MKGAKFAKTVLRSLVFTKVQDKKGSWPLARTSSISEQSENVSLKEQAAYFNTGRLPGRPCYPTDCLLRTACVTMASKALAFADGPTPHFPEPALTVPSKLALTLAVQKLPSNRSTTI